MSRLFFASILFLAGPTAFAKPETRNGWYVNETPGNMALIDRDSEWIIGVQGGSQADWQTDVDFFANDDQFVQSNPPHGYACVSMRVESDHKTKRILKVLGGRQLRLKDCLEDREIPLPVR